MDILVAGRFRKILCILDNLVIAAMFHHFLYFFNTAQIFRIKPFQNTKIRWEKIRVLWVPPFEFFFDLNQNLCFVFKKKRMFRFQESSAHLQQTCWQDNWQFKSLLKSSKNSPGRLLSHCPNNESVLKIWSIKSEPPPWTSLHPIWFPMFLASMWGAVWPRRGWWQCRSRPGCSLECASEIGTTSWQAAATAATGWPDGARQMAIKRRKLFFNFKEVRLILSGKSAGCRETTTPLLGRSMPYNKNGHHWLAGGGGQCRGSINWAAEGDHNCPHRKPTGLFDSLKVTIFSVFKHKFNTPKGNGIEFYHKHSLK